MCTLVFSNSEKRNEVGLISLTKLELYFHAIKYYEVKDTVVGVHCERDRAQNPFASQYEVPQRIPICDIDGWLDGFQRACERVVMSSSRPWP